jgi:phosphatidate cytidylyltransferase
MSNLAKRILFAVVAIPVVIAIIWVGGWVLAAALAVLGALGTGEVYGLARRQGIEPLAPAGLVAALAIPLVAHWTRGPAADAGMAWSLGVLWLLAVPALAMRRGPTARPLATSAITVFGALYASGTLAFVLWLRHPGGGPDGALPRTALVLFPMVVTWLCDTAAMAAGRTFGGPRLAPVLSPHKTWAGAIGGAAAALVVAVALGLLVLHPLGWALPLPVLLAVGLAVGVLGQLGDVAESLFKREAGVKDSSTLIPGHGGVLDRLDSLYYVIPVSAVLLAAFGAI